MSQKIDVLKKYPDAVALGELFARAGFQLYLVGGIVRDIIRHSQQNSSDTFTDFDLTTDAEPEQIQQIIAPWAEKTWDIGKEYGTISARKNGVVYEITTYRAEVYASDSRKPTVTFGKDLREDLIRRDFTMNAMAARLPDGAIVDLFEGQRDLAEGIIRTPRSPQDSFSEDPLRMMRAARFVARFNMKLAPEVFEAMEQMASRIEIISAERVRDELVKLIVAPYPKAGIEVLVDSGLADFVLPELPALRMEIDPAHHHKDVYWHSLKVMEQAMDRETGPEGDVPAPDFILRFASLLHDIGKPATRKFEADGSVTFLQHELVGAKLARKRMRALRFDNDTIKAVSRLIELHMRFYGYRDAGWSDSAVRRYVRDAGEQLQRLHRLSRSDVTTSNKRMARSLAAAYDDLEERIEALAAQEELDAIRPDLDGGQIMALLNLAPGPQVGRAYKFLMDLRMEEGPLGQEEASARLLAWWNEQQES
ncbi:MAG: CCA tRNA nucleotidyltransferase [Rothia sp. (in: high G+C Gram-positive bacteria)]|uniref:CCA tRNA nucleotidyltransferase n=1 Tax=Rothia sp. (in: high G+C Gram-positive bacteria) TaxID=1885016 RepID=UPI0026DFEA93|nr:CCA tRNA nucleotidyltransferase [Rothia sp. (in: high G+C Gram-positive bacteria)]MDO5749585.1 CCA tRNA nucleotidyltransferase [Rothia sp. (in: high G+C Gram-positive bacteria)]